MIDPRRRTAVQHPHHISELRGLHRGQPAYIVGMGPSLLNLTPQHFVNGGPIIATYESITLLEGWGLRNPIYSMQKDTITGLPRYSPLLLHRHESARERCTYEPRYVFDTMEKEFWPSRCSGITSIRIALLLGARHITILCFDRTTTGDRRRAMWVDGRVVVDAAEDHTLFDLKDEIESLVRQSEAECTWITPQENPGPVLANQ